MQMSLGTYIDVGVIFLNYADLLFQTSIFTADNNI